MIHCRVLWEQRRVLPFFRNYSKGLVEKGGLEPSVLSFDVERYLEKAIDKIKKQNS
jgi:hypothetical protein